MKTKVLFTILVLVLSGCSCRNPAIKVIEPINSKTDPFLSCSQLKFALAEAEYFLRTAERKEEKTEAYAGTPFYLLSTQFTIIQAQEAAKDRIDYLNTIMQQKKCSENKPSTQKVIDKDLVKLPIDKKSNAQ